MLLPVHRQDRSLSMKELRRLEVGLKNFSTKVSAILRIETMRAIRGLVLGNNIP